MDVELLTALTDALLLLLEARCNIEGDVALLSTVNSDLRRLLRHLRSRTPERQQQLPEFVLVTHQQLQQLHIAQQLQQHSESLYDRSRPQAGVSHTASLRSRSAQCLKHMGVVSAQVGPGKQATAVHDASASARHTPAAAHRRAQNTQQPVRRPASSGNSRNTLGIPRTISGRQQVSTSRPGLNTGSFVQPATAATAGGALRTSTSVSMQPCLHDQQQAESVAALVELPSSFTQLLQQYSNLQQQQQLKGIALQDRHKTGVTAPAAASFVSRLQKAYGSREAGAMPAQQQQQGAGSSARQRCLDEAGHQAYYIGLVSAALLAAQALTRPGTPAGGSMTLQHMIGSIFQQCQHWLKQHDSRQQEHQQQQQRQHGPCSAPTGAQLADPDCKLQDALRWRNRCLRSILSTTRIVEAGTLDEPGHSSCCRHLQVAAAAPAAGIWLPEECWQPLGQTAAEAAAASSSNASSSQAQRAWHRLLPSWPLLHQQCLATDGTTSQLQAGSGGNEGLRLPALCYSEVQGLVQHSRHLQKLQKLLLHQHVEAQLAPHLMQCLSTECQALWQNSISYPSQPKKEDKRQLQQNASSTSAIGAAKHLERCLCLYRLLHSLLAAPSKRRGLGGGCHFVQHETLEDVSTLQWL